MAKAPTAVEIRPYQVGFGDCFLLSFVYGPRDRRHVLIDFGTTGLSEKRKKGEPPPPRPRKPAPKPSEHLPRVAADIRAVCEATSTSPRLTAVVATHRHADHISGFATDGASGGAGKIIAALRPKVVIQPWTEDPKAAPQATHASTTPAAGAARLVASLASMNLLAQGIVDLAARGALDRLSATTRKQLEFLGLDNIANRSAIDNLREMGSKPHGRSVYARYGDDVGLGRLLPGVKVRVLGPPDLTQSKDIAKQTSKNKEEFWHLMGATTVAAAARSTRGASGGARIPATARWFRRRLDAMQGQALLQIVRRLDDQLNNTSLILLFEVGGKKLLFPGDAQLENWRYALAGPHGAENRARLADVDVYKVGHHGSLNATPQRLLWANFRKRGATAGARMLSLLSTKKSNHGSTASRTEVPRATLKAALAEQTDLHDTEGYPASTLVVPITIPL